MATTKYSDAMGMTREAFDKYVPNAGLAVLRREEQNRDAGHGLVLVERSDDKRKVEPTFATVIRLGPEDRDDRKGRRVPWSIKPGDRVVLDRFAGHDVEISETGERFVVTGETDILAVLTEIEE